MLKLKPVFTDALAALAVCGGRLQVPPLVATVYLMQRDVINQYQFAMGERLCRPHWDWAPRGGSLDTPLQTWATLTSDEFGVLSFHVRNLVRYTARLLAEAARCDEVRSGAYEQAVANRLTYANVLATGWHEGRAIGVRVEAPNTVVVTPMETDGAPAESSGLVRTWSDDAERTGVLRGLLVAGYEELFQLCHVHYAFDAACQDLYDSRPAVEAFENRHPSDCL